MSLPPLPAILEGHGVRLEAMELAHVAALEAAAADGELWRARFSSVPEPGRTHAYVETALADRGKAVRWPFVVRERGSDQIIGSTSYHDMVPAVPRVEIGYTWYARSWQRTHVNTACKWLLLEYAFEQLGCPVVGWRADALNLRSQAAIERLGAKKDGVIRGTQLRRDGSLRDTVMYSVTAAEWQGELKAHLRGLLQRTSQR
jgi:RimJ/RimL family protein N-acetyltransferase